MEEIFDIIATFPGECIAIVIGTIGAIIAIASIKDGRERNRDANQKGADKPGKTGVVHYYLLVLWMVVLCGAILSIAYRTRKPNPPEPQPPSSAGTQSSGPETTGGSDTTVTPKTPYELEFSDYASIKASSTYTGDRATHLATNLIDGKKDTNWTEGVEGYGTGEYIQFTFNGSHTITGFRIWSGNHASDSYYTKNARPEVIKLTFEDGTFERFTILDAMQEQPFTLSKAVTTKSIRLTIESVYEGSAYEDTVISEIAFRAEK